MSVAAAAALSVAAVFPSVPAVAAKRPSFVVLFADDMGWSQPSNVSDRSPFAGDNGTIRTPNLDALAAEGMVFDSWCVAGRSIDRWNELDPGLPAARRQRGQNVFVRSTHCSRSRPISGGPA